MWSWLWYLGPLFQALMAIHFFRTRPEGYWIFIIVFLGPVGALAYFALEVAPGLRVKPPWLARAERKRRRQLLEMRVAESPALEPLYELAELCATDGDHARAVELFGRVLARDGDSQEARHGRGKSLMALGQVDQAIADLEPLVKAKPNYQLYDAYVALAECYDRAGRLQHAQAAYEDLVNRTTVSRAYYGYAMLLDRMGQKENARDMMRRILAKKLSLPRYLRRQERPWFRKAEAFLKTGG